MTDNKGNVVFSDPLNQVKLVIQRAETLGLKIKDRLSTTMDIEAANGNGRIDFDKWLAFPDCDFVHDFYGIIRNMNRTIGDLDNYFLPRSAK